MNHTNIFGFLPNELLDEILKDIWYDYFSSNVLSNLKNTCNKIEIINKTINKYIHRSQDTKKSSVLNSFLEYNHFLKNLKTNKGLYRFIINKYPHYHLDLITDTYLNNCFNDINIGYKYICAYAVVNGNPYMSYNNKYKFRSIVTNNHP